jgi:hypothetical protein
MALQPFVAFSFSWSYTQSVGPFGRGISPSQSLYLHKKQHKHIIDSQNTDIHALSGIRTHDRSVRANEDSSCLRSRRNCDRPTTELQPEKQILQNDRTISTRQPCSYRFCFVFRMSGVRISARRPAISMFFFVFHKPSRQIRRYYITWGNDRFFCIPSCSPCSSHLTL